MDFHPIRLFSKLSIHTLYTIYVLEFSPDYRFYGERHNFWEIAYFIEGKAGVTSDDRVFDCVAGDMTIQRPGVFHSMWAASDKNFKFSSSHSTATASTIQCRAKSQTGRL